MSEFATLVLVVRLDEVIIRDDNYDELERAALQAAGIHHQPTDESMFLHVEHGVSAEALRLGALPADWEQVE